MRRILCLALVVVMSFTVMACQCEHVWVDATLDAPKTCTQCETTEGSSIREMLIGSWIESGKGASYSYLRVDFTDVGYEYSVIMGGEKSIIGSQGIYLITKEPILNLVNSNSKHFTHFTYRITSENTIKLFDSDGKEWVKTEL